MNELVWLLKYKIAVRDLNVSAEETQANYWLQGNPMNLENNAFEFIQSFRGVQVEQ